MAKNQTDPELEKSRPTKTAMASSGSAAKSGKSFGEVMAWIAISFFAAAVLFVVIFVSNFDAMTGSHGPGGFLVDLFVAGFGVLGVMVLLASAGVFAVVGIISYFVSLYRRNPDK